MVEIPLLDAARIERLGGFLVAGVKQRYALARDLEAIVQGVGRQWADLRPRLIELGWPHAGDAYGVCLRVSDGDTAFDYFCGLGIPDESRLPADLSLLALPPLRCAAFRYRGPKQMLASSYFAIFGRLLPEAGLVPADRRDGTPEFIERFDAGYDLATETGGPEILVPLKD